MEKKGGFHIHPLLLSEVKTILLISDTHGSFPASLADHASTCDEIWHAGDIGNLDVLTSLEKIKPLKAVYGNIDGAELRKVCKEDLIFECENVKVYITHIGGYPGKYLARIRQKLEELKPGLFICGHSHILKVMYDKQYNFLHMNPGACGKYGFHQKITMLRFKITQDKIHDLEVIESKKS